MGLFVMLSEVLWHPVAWFKNRAAKGINPGTDDGQVKPQEST